MKLIDLFKTKKLDDVPPVINKQSNYLGTWLGNFNQKKFDTNKAMANLVISIINKRARLIGNTPNKVFIKNEPATEDNWLYQYSTLKKKGIIIILS